MVRKARLSDAKAIHKLINYYAKKNIMLPRALNDICEAIRDFWVYDDGGILGCAALRVYSDELAEIRSLAVDKSSIQRGIGSELLGGCVKEAARLGIDKVFALTVVPGFFEKSGFRAVDKSKLPQKIWTDCAVCSKLDKCDEIAYITRLK
ncbi:MAG: N-acetyltransferase [Candidatus Omnitrophota bacterium]